MNSPYARSNDEVTFELTVKGNRACCCCNHFQTWLYFSSLLAGFASFVCWYFIFVQGIPLYDPACQSLFWCITCFFIATGAGYFTIRANDHGMRVDYGPCPCYQRCLCCGCCVPRSRGETTFEAITNVQLVERSQCLDGCGITENRCNNVWVMNLGCCVPSVVITRRYDPTDGCCAYTNLMIGLDSQEEAEELLSFLEEKIKKNDPEVGRCDIGTVEGSQPALGLSSVSAPTAPPSYATVQY